jgi:hypothetical protein
LPLRTLYKLRLVDVGPVSFPAYSQTSSLVVRGVTAEIAHRQALQAAIARARALRV